MYIALIAAFALVNAVLASASAFVAAATLSSLSSSVGGKAFAAAKSSVALVTASVHALFPSACHEPASSVNKATAVVVAVFTSGNAKLNLTTVPTVTIGVPAGVFVAVPNTFIGSSDSSITTDKSKAIFFFML
ncbi:MAG: hypothetical protein FWE82_05985 [Defluviitaleaceae bacterium]|nr:hypothetical protein [Defluviitaleaceae bacterium]